MNFVFKMNGTKILSTLLRYQRIISRGILFSLFVLGHLFRRLLVGRIFLLSGFILPGLLIGDLLQKGNLLEFSFIEKFVIGVYISFMVNLLLFLFAFFCNLLPFYFYILLSQFGFLLGIAFYLHLNSSFHQSSTIEKSKLPFLLLFLMLTVFVAILRLKFFRTLGNNIDLYYVPDCYTYMARAKNPSLFFLSRKTNLIGGKIGWVLLTASFFQLTSFSFVNAGIFIAFVYILLIPITYLLGSLYNRKTGFFAGVLTPFFPILWWWLSQPMQPMMSITFFTSLTGYFYVKMRKKTQKFKKYLLFFLLTFFSGFFFKKSIFLLFLPILLDSLFFALIDPKERKRNLILFLVLLLLIFPVSTTQFFFSHLYTWSLYRLKTIVHVFFFSPSQWYHFLLRDPSHAISVWSYPYFYTHSVIFLALIGVIDAFQKEKAKRETLFFFTVILCYFFYLSIFHGPSFRHIPVFPTVMVFASLGVFSEKESTRKSVPLIVVGFVAYYLLNPLLIPAFSYAQAVRVVPNVYLILSKILGILVIGFKLLTSIPNKFLHSLLLHKRKIRYQNLVRGGIIAMVLLSSFWYGTAFSLYGGNNDREIRNSAKGRGILKASTWIKQSLPSNSTVFASSARYLHHYFDNHIRILPSLSDLWLWHEGGFLEGIQNKTFRYFIYLGRSRNHRDWLKKYENQPPPLMKEVGGFQRNGTTVFRVYERKPTNKTAYDKDLDGLPDYWEKNQIDNATGLDPHDDQDDDGLVNLNEYKWGTDPFDPDSDSDGLADGVEILKYESLPWAADTSGDGIEDGLKVKRGRNPTHFARLSRGEFSPFWFHWILVISIVIGIGARGLFMPKEKRLLKKNSRRLPI